MKSNTPKKPLKSDVKKKTVKTVTKKKTAKAASKNQPTVKAQPALKAQPIVKKEPSAKEEFVKSDVKKKTFKSDILTIIALPLLIVFSYICFDTYKDAVIENSRFLSLYFNTKNFEDMVQKIDEQPDINNKMPLAIDAAKYAVRNKTLYLSSDKIEKVFTDIAEQNDIELYPASEVIKNSVLHIASELYNTGGHTRVIERWVETSPDTETHSLLLTRNSIVPERLREAIEAKNGKVMILDQTLPDVKAALALRRIASQYEKIVLHIHMDDHLPLIAFGTSKFPRPVIFFNHADHLFWIGVSIADHIIDLREHGHMLTTDFRGSLSSSIIYLPVDVKEKPQIDKKQSREMFGLPQDRPIIFTSGAPHKFKPIKNLDYSLFMKKVLKRQSNAFFVLVAPSKDMFKNIKDISEQNYKFLSAMPNDEYIKCLASADLVVDSMPNGGFLTLVDAVSAGIPVLSLKRDAAQLDFITHSKAYISGMDELAQAAVDILNSEEKRRENVESITSSLAKISDTKVYQKKIHDLYKTYKIHAVHPFKSRKLEY